MVEAQPTGGQSRPGGRAVLVTPSGEEVGSALIPRRGGGGEQARNQREAERRRLAEREQARKTQKVRQEAIRKQVLANQERARKEAIRREQIRQDRLKAKLILQKAQQRSIDVRNKKGQIIREQVLINQRTKERIVTRTNLATGEKNIRTFEKSRNGRAKVRQTGEIVEQKTKLQMLLPGIKPVIALVKPTEEKRKDIGEEFFFGRVLGVKPGLGTGFQKDPQFSSGEKFSARFVLNWAGNKFDKFLRNSEDYKQFSKNLDLKINLDTKRKFLKDNILQPLSEDALTFGATSPFFKSTTKLKNEFLLDEIAKLNKQSAREFSLGVGRKLKGGADEIILASEKTSKNFKIKTITTYKIARSGGKNVIVRGGKGATKLINKRTGETIGKPIEFTFFGKGKEATGKFIKIGKEGEKLIQSLGKAKAGTGQVKILTKDLKVIRSRFGTIFKNMKNLELSLSGRIPRSIAKEIKFEDLKIKGFKEKKLSLSIRNLLLRFRTKAKLFGTKKTVKLDVNDLAIIRKFAPKIYNKIITSKKTTATGTGKNIKVKVNTKELGKSFGQVVSKEVENLLTGKAVAGIRRSKSVDRILRATSGRGVVGKGKGVVGIAKKQKLVPVSVTRTTTISKTKKATLSKTKKATISKSKQKKKQAQRVVTKLKQKLAQATKTKKAISLKLKLKLKEKGRGRIIPRIKIPIKPSFPTIIPVLKFKKRKVKKVIIKKKGKQSFDVFAKPVKGKRLIKINKKPLSRTDAKGLRNLVIDTSLSRQGSIKPRKGIPKKPSIKVPRGFAKITSKKFRRFRIRKGKIIRLPKGRVIERSKHLLDTRQERRKISLRRRIKQLRSKKKPTKKPVKNQPPKRKNNNALQRQRLLNLKKARRIRALNFAARRRSTAASQLTRRRRIISII